MYCPPAFDARQRCGRKLYDDYQELCPGSVRKLGERLNHNHMRSSARTTTAASLSNAGLMSGLFKAASLRYSSSSKPLDNGARVGPSLPQYNTSGVHVPGTARGAAIAHREQRYLLLCIPHRRHATKMLNIDIHEEMSDCIFFQTLRSQYSALRGSVRSHFSIKSLSAIRFVEVSAPCVYQPISKGANSK